MDPKANQGFHDYMQELAANKQSVWDNFYASGEYGMYPTTVFGFVLVLAACLYFMRPEQRYLPINRVRARDRLVRAQAVESRTTVASSDGEEVLAAREQSAALDRAVARLPAPMVQLHSLRSAGFSYDEIADILDLPLGTVKSRTHELISRLKQERGRWTVN